VNEVGQNGGTALMAAIREQNLDHIQYLIEHGADVHIQDYDNHTALELARFLDDDGSMREICTLLEKEEKRQLEN